ncbi:MAG: RNA 2',3'-cyclic phosphodiesterase [Oceanospirillales bacterium]|nr:RNA 2',3'-cyclic phosphodiesterase [Oceanospirillales bacterium]
MEENKPANRLFIAIDLSEAIQTLVARRLPELRDIRWVAPERLHLTLAFIGELKEEQMQPLDTALSDIAFHPFELELNRVGTFSHSTLWIGCEPCDPLVELRSKIREALKLLNISLDPRPYQPHITLAYNKEPLAEHTIAQLDAELLPEPIEMVVDQFALKNSILNNGNAPIHQVIRLYNAAN